MDKAKTVYFVCPKFHGYEDKIRSTLQAKGLRVYSFFYDETAIINFPVHKKVIGSFFFMMRLLFNANKKLLAKVNGIINGLKDFDELNSALLGNFEEALQSNKKGKFDYILVIKGFGLNQQIIKTFKANVVPNNFILYQWDSLSRFPNVIENYRWFDVVWTFEEDDVKLFPGSMFYPTFFLPIQVGHSEEYFKDELKNIEGYSDKNRAELIYIGTFNIPRFLRLYKIARRLDKFKVSYFFYLWVKGKKPLVRFKRITMSTRSIRPELTYYLYSKSKGIFDIGHKGQLGLTTRAYEAVFLNKKLVTEYKLDPGSLKDVLNSDFNLSLEEFIEKRAAITDSAPNIRLISQLSLESWVDKILCL